MTGRDKSGVADLALFGGPPLFDRTLTVGRPNIMHTEVLHAHLQGVLQRGWLTNDGPLVQEFERRCAALLDVPHCIAVSNATIGLQVVAAALDLRGRVLMPAFTFIGTAHALRWMGLEPEFCEVRPEDHTLDPDDVARRLGPGVGAILGVHLWGRACQHDALQALADRHGVPLFYDAAHAFACGHAGRPIGRLGAAEVFSLHATKAINAFEGGLITTVDGALAERLRLMRNFGIRSDGRVVSLGTNAKMNEACAAAGLANLDGLDALCAHNRSLAEAYREALAGVPGLRLHGPAPGERFTHHYAVVELPADGPHPAALAELLLAEGVYVRRYFEPGCHRCPPYDTQPMDLPVTDRLARTLVQLPTGWQLVPHEAAALGRLLAWCVAEAPSIEAHRTRR